MIADDSQKKAIGLRIKEARSAIGFTQKELCEKAGMKLPSLRDYELGNSIPGGEAVAYLMRVGISANWLLSGEGPMLLSDLLDDVLQDLTEEESLRKTAGAMRRAVAAREVLNPARLRMAIILTEDSAAVHPLTPEQRADMILSFYQRLSKGDAQ